MRRGICLDSMGMVLFGKAPGEFAWSRVDRDAARIERFGMKPALSVWPQHMPRWVDLVRLKCLEHQQESDIPSLWDERLLERDLHEARILETGEPWQGAGKRYEWKNAEGQAYVTQYASGRVCFDPSASTIY